MYPNQKKAVVLLSGGLDSVVTLAEGCQHYDVVLAITFNYGQRAFGKEIKASRYIADHYGVKHEIIALPWLSAMLPKAMMMRKEGRDPEVPMEWIKKGERAESFFEAKPVWVPNRNGLFLNIAASFAEGLGAQVILFGANLDEAEQFPDNRQVFRQQVNNLLNLSTLTHPQVEAPLENMTKAQIVDRARELKVPLHIVWSCYTDADKQCGNCPSCIRLKQALKQSESGKKSFANISFIY